MDLNLQLFKACVAGKSSEICALLEAGADANAIIQHSYDTEHLYDNWEGITPLMVYLDCSHAYYDDEVERILPTVQCFLDHGANINSMATERERIPGLPGKAQESPLSYSQFLRGTVLMEFLLSHGADPNLTREDDGGSFLDSVSLDYDTPEDDILTDAKIDLLKRYGAKSAWAGEIP